LLLRTYDQSEFACLPDVLLAYRLDEISWRKTRSGRLNLLPWFWRAHFARGRYGYAVMSVVGILLKLVIEFGALKFGSHDRLRELRTREMDANDLRQWQAVWQAYGNL
jgi:hypothetical protein